MKFTYFCSSHFFIVNLFLPHSHLNTKDTPLSRWQVLLQMKIRLSHAVVIVILFLSLMAAGQIAIYKYWHVKNPSTALVSQNDDCPPPPTVRYRMNEYQFTRPLLLGDRLNESKDLLPLKNEVAQLVNQQKQSGIIDDATVYIKSMNTPDWVCVNPGAEFNPGSLIKVPIMMTFLRESEKKPELLTKKFSLNPSDRVPPQTFKGDRVIPGKSYTLKELLYYMIAKSDNYATSILNNNVNVGEFQQLFVDLGMPRPDIHDPSFFISAADYSKFMRVLYNSSFLNIDNSEFALSLLSQSDFKEGIVKPLPAETQVAHKFGEWGKPDDPTNHQLHESGIVYIANSPYIITIMTKGRNVQPLPHILSDISALVYNRMTEKQLKN